MFPRLFVYYWVASVYCWRPILSLFDDFSRWTDEEEEEEWNLHPHFGRLSRYRVLQREQQHKQQRLHHSFEIQPATESLCSDCYLTSSVAEMDNQPQPQQQLPVRRRNSTYLALACANAVSQGAMTRSLRQMFETQPIRETQPLLSRAEIQQAIQAAKLRRNSIAVCSSTNIPEPDVVTAIPAVVIATAPSSLLPDQRFSPDKNSVSVPTSPVKTPLSSPIRGQTSSTTTPTSTPPPTSPFGQVGGVRCDKCSSILSPASSPVSVVINAPVMEEEEFAVGAEDKAAVAEMKSPSKIIPTNREVVEEELPKPDTVKNARCLFESTLMEMTNGSYSTLQHIKSNNSLTNKIVRSESTMTLDRASSRSFLSGSRPTTFRWPSRLDNIRRSPSPSPISSPLPTLAVPVNQSGSGGSGGGKSHKMASTLPSYYRSSPSLTQYRSSRHSLHSTDVESYVSEAGSDCWSSSDLESEASYSASSRGDESSAAGVGDGLDGMRYISPDVMEKIRSYGMTLTFVNGKMVDEDDEQDEPEVVAKQVATRKVVQSIRSAGQSQPMATKKSAPPPVAPKKSKHHPETSPQQQLRIVACLPKPTERQQPTTTTSPSNSKKIKKIRHSSGESSASSGVSSGTNADSSSEHNSPFATLKRTKSADADHTLERSPSPGPRRSGTIKEVGSSPFGCYSVVYSFGASARSPMYV